MLTSPTMRRAQTLGRRQRVTNVNRPTVGQCFDIDISWELGGWHIRIPEIGATTHARRRAGVELAARECIAAKTGIPIGYVAILVANETLTPA